MRKNVLKNARQKLLAIKKQILREIDDGLRERREGAKEDGMDTYDLASEERDREIDFILSDREREKLQAIDDVLGRIEEGSYGICDSCESEIAPGRLDALPFTRLCVSCQSEREKEAKASRRFEDERAYRRLGSTEAEDETS
jgi:DnaK suppressor protein